MMAAVLSIEQEAFDHPLYEKIMLHAMGDRNDHFLAVILSSWLSKQGVLPRYLGLSLADFRIFMNSQFPGFCINENFRKNEVFTDERMPEKDDLITLFSGYRAYRSASEIWISYILTAGCLGSNHLWQDLGLWDRQQLTRLMSINYPALAAQNKKNMKWKKFLYKQLCSEQGIYTCRSPSCEVCIDYVVCFGSED